MSIIKDHSITRILKNKNLRNDPEILEAICDVLKGLDDDIDKVGELIIGIKTDRALEELNEAVTRAESENDPEEMDEDEDDLSFIGNDDEDDIEDESFVDEDDEEERG